MRSVFGDMQHVQRLAHRLHAIASGNPRDLLALAQDMLDRGVVRYEAGAWSLSANVEDVELPASMAQALMNRMQRLSPAARELACTWSLAPDVSMSFEECIAVSQDGPSSRPGAVLDELLHAQIVELASDRYALSAAVSAPVLRNSLSEDTKRRMHVRLSRMFALREANGIPEAFHLLFGGESERGLDALVAICRRLGETARANMEIFTALVRTLPPDWYEALRLAIDLCDRLNRSRGDVLALLLGTSPLTSLAGIIDRELRARTLASLRRDSGLADWEELPADMPPDDRLRAALERTQARFATATAHDRGLEPLAAIRALANATIEAVAVVSHSIDYELSVSLPSLEPFEALSPALGVIDRLVLGSRARITGRFDTTRQRYYDLLRGTERIEQTGLDESQQVLTRQGVMCGLGMLEASMGLASSMGWARQIEHEPTHRINALLIEMLHCQWTGRMREAARIKHRIELLRIQHGSLQYFEGMHLLYQIGATVAAEGLTLIRQTLEEIERMARRFAAWTVVRDYARAEYERLRGDAASACGHLERALSGCEAGLHQFWHTIAAAHVRVLLELGRVEDARRLGEQYLVAAQNAGLGYAANFVRVPLAVAQARAGDHATALRTADAAIVAFRTLRRKNRACQLRFGRVDARGRRRCRSPLLHVRTRTGARGQAMRRRGGRPSVLRGAGIHRSRAQ